MRSIASAVFGAALVGFVLSGCAASAGPVPGGSPSPSIAGKNFLCGGWSIPRAAVESRVPLSAIPPEGRAALEAAVWDDGAPLDLPAEEGWYVAMTTDDLVGVMRDVPVVPDPVSGGIYPDREVRMVEWVADATNLTPGWYVSMSGPCALTVDLGDLSVPAVELREPPDPASSQLTLLVTEQSCNSGEDAQGRVEVVSINETDERVSLVLGVRPRDGMMTCPSHPATPFTVTLAKPVGNRELLDVGLAEPRPLSTPPPLPAVLQQTG
jgi:hypothetical protein